MMWPALKLLVDHIQPQRKQTNLIVGLYKSVWHTWPCMGPGNNRQPMLKKGAKNPSSSAEYSEIVR